MNELGEPDAKKLAALEERVAAMMRPGSQADSYEETKRTADALARARTDTLLKDTLAFTVARMWATLAALVAPLFVVFARRTPPENPAKPAPGQAQASDKKNNPE